MNNNQFDPHSPRARQAKTRQVLQKLEIPLLLVGVLALSLWFCLLFFLHSSWGWLALAVSICCVLLATWSIRGLKHIPTLKTDDINDLLSGATIIALIKSGGQITVELVEQLLLHTKSGRFLQRRLEINGAMIGELFAPTTPSSETVFQTAKTVRERANSAQIGGGDLVIAIILCCPDYENILKRYHFEPEDFYATLSWFNYLFDLAARARKPVRTGGVARDLNFGYIPTLQHFGKDVSSHASRRARSQLYYTNRGEILEKMVQIFSSGARQNIALIGPEGSGRSLIVQAFAETLLDEESKIPSNLKYRQIFQLDAAALLSAAGNQRGNLEGLLTKIFNEAYSAKNIIIYLNNAQLFFSDGMGSVDLTNFLLPIIEAGKLRIILSIEEQEFLRLATRSSGVANMFNRINVLAADQAATLRTLEDQVPLFEAQLGVYYTYPALKEAYRLGDRYITDRAEPGRALRMLEISGNYADERRIVDASAIRTAVEASLGVKVKVADNSADRDRLLNMEELIHQRMVNQVEAVKTVSSALQRAAAGVRNQNRPIGTFLFLGPTGVGKTELAKAISDVYFHGEGAIIRLDLNEFVNANDVSRLIVDGAEDEMSLTAQVMKKPFAIVLLDEIEKAHPQVLTALLQVLDEGVLRDVKNREVSFRDTIIIATSNAGADSIRRYIDEGIPFAEIKTKLLDQLIDTGEFRPEFLNRFDEVCVFTPLSKTDLLKIVDLMLASTNKVLAAQKITVRLDEDAKLLLVERGYDPKLGARPMRRIIQKTVENLAARAILSGTASAGSVISLTAAEVASELD